MVDKSIVELRSEIAWYHLEELEQELGWLKSLILLPIKNKVKDIIAWKWELSDKFDKIEEFWIWKNVINFITPSTAEQIYKFMKEKREELIKKNTEEELIQLKNELIQNLNKHKKVGRKNKETISQSNVDRKYVYWRNLTNKHLNIIWNKMKQKFPTTPLNANMIKVACENNTLLPVEYLLAFMQNDSWLWTAGKWARTRNPWNVWNDDSWRTLTYHTRQEWVDACANNLQKRIDSYFAASARYNWVWFNNFPTPEELATWKSKWWKKFFGVYMTAPNWPSRVASMVKERNKDLVA